MYSNQQAIYFKNYLTVKSQGNDVTRLNSSLHESRITINPHQVNAALSFFKNPLNKGFIFADEVGLGKTIEAGIIISQYWYERKRRIIIICPASLMKQWNEELYDKFHLQSIIVDSKLLKNKSFNWGDNIYITSLHSVYLNKEFFNYKFDLVVIDEAHKLRNVYKDKGIMASSIKEVFSGQKKLLLTATPFQNNLMELFGLISLLDENIFPDEKIYRQKYILNYDENKNELFQILSNYVVRTLRKNVSKYVNYTNRNVLLADYYTTPEEKKFYSLVSNVLYSNDFSEVYSLGQNQLLIILLQKLLSSSISAVVSTLKNMRNNLSEKNTKFEDGDIIDSQILNSIPNNEVNPLIKNIDSIIDFSNTIKTDSKYNCLKSTLGNIRNSFFSDLTRNKKILIFTESKKTQEYLYRMLKKDGFDSILTFNGENDTNQVKEIYKKWIDNNPITQNSNKTANIRRAIIDAFEKDYEILIATDSAAEGLNMQFCSILINYDLPWNPQKIEQRIGRCHRYGQKNDVIVINLLNRSSTIDQRIYELLNSKLGVFEATFGSSDMILGNDNIANDIETSIKEIYKISRSPDEIEKLFTELQQKFKKEIDDAIKLSENEMESYLDEEVQRNFELQYIKANQTRNEYEEILQKLIYYIYPKIQIDNKLCFELDGLSYSITNNFPQKIFVSLNSPFGEKLISSINDSTTIIDNISFYYSKSKTKIGYVDTLNSKKGVIVVSKIVYDSFELSESLVLSGITENNEIIPADIIHKIFKLNSSVKNGNEKNDLFFTINNIHKIDIDEKVKEIEKHNNEIFSQESNFIDNWADSMIEKIQLEVTQMREERKELQKQFDFTTNINEQTMLQNKISMLSKKITKLWISLATAEDEINERRNALISNLLSEKNKQISIQELFKVEFEIL